MLLRTPNTNRYFVVCINFRKILLAPDGAILDPADSQNPFGFVEIKCPFNNQTQEACTTPNSFL